MADPASFDRILSFAQKNQGDGITALVSSGCPVTHANRVGQTAFHIASLWGNADALKALIACIEDPADKPKILNEKNKISGATPLHCAANSNKEISGRVACVKILLENGADPNVVDSYESKPLDYTDHPDFRQLLGGTSLALHDLLKSYDTAGAFATLDAAFQTQLEQMDGNAVNATDSKGTTAAMLACTRFTNADDAAALVERLVAAGGDCKLRDDEDRSALHHAVMCDHEGDVGGRVALVKLLLAEDVSPDEQDRTEFDAMGGRPEPHYSALMYAVERGDADLVGPMMEAGADAGVTDEDFETAVHKAFFAHSSPRLDILELLKPTPLLLNQSCKRLGMQTKGKEGEGNTLLHEYSKKGKVDVISFLLANKANVDAVGRQGMTALHLAARGCKAEVVGLLLKAGASRDIEDSAGKTPMSYAEAQGERGEEVVKLLG